ncbi:MAG: hypothetical protein OXR66_03575 [Candidatus Woesearchaeota archaeon]|nr:hypothetical protein [Candidatus Woesearchaeota archaeon]
MKQTRRELLMNALRTSGVVAAASVVGCEFPKEEQLLDEMTLENGERVLLYGKGWAGAKKIVVCHENGMEEVMQRFGSGFEYIRRQGKDVAHHSRGPLGSGFVEYNGQRTLYGNGAFDEDARRIRDESLTVVQETQPRFDSYMAQFHERQSELMRLAKP